MQLQLQTFEIVFEHLLVAVRDGISLAEFARLHTPPIPTAEFRHWVMSNPRRKNAYREAQEIGAEAIADTLIPISDGLNSNGDASPEEVQRSNLRIDTRRKQMVYMNRKRFGDIKQIEQKTATTIDFSNMNINELKTQLLIEAGVLSVDGELIDG
jgi:hypothetical protein